MLGKNLIQAAAGNAAGEVLGVEDVFSTFLYTGNGNNQSIVNGIALADGVEIPIGTALGGGYFAGFVDTTAVGAATHALIVAPRATGATGTGYSLTTNLQWKTSESLTSNTTSPIDGAANTAAMIAAGASAHPAAQFCNNLTIGGFSDWYLPARYELDIAYFNLKPSTDANSTSMGLNAYAIPPRSSTNYTTNFPPQTSISAFQIGSSEAFVNAIHWSSTENNIFDGWTIDFSDGFQTNAGKSSSYRVRAFRRIPINDSSLDPYRVTGEGGLVWLKRRDVAEDHLLYDTARGATEALKTSTTGAGIAVGTGTLSFLSTGFSINTNYSDMNAAGGAYTSWTFRKAPKFFDVVTYTGNGTNGRQISHNLGSVPGCIVVKRTDSSDYWAVYHRSIPTQRGQLNTNLAFTSINAEFVFGDGVTTVQPTSTHFTVGAPGEVNSNGGTYVAYLFAHDAGGFGESGDQSVIKCGSFTASSSNRVNVDLGWEAQFVIAKASSVADSWMINDVMRGLPIDGNTSILNANSSASESTSLYPIHPTPTGFTVDTGYWANGTTVIYIAIRRGPMKTPTDATKVFSAVAYTGNNANNRAFTDPGFAPDFMITRVRNQSGNAFTSTRLSGPNRVLFTDSTDAEYSTASAFVKSFDQLGWTFGTSDSAYNLTSWTYINESFRRAPGFFDVVAYTGTGASSQTINHNLTVSPELLIVKNRSISDNWVVYSAPLGIGATSKLVLSGDGQANTTDGRFPSLPTSSVFYVGSDNETGASTRNYIAYLFATVPGVSKVGSYTGTGTTLNVDCGFTTGARFVLIKRTDSTGDWYVWDSARGIVAANDPYLLLNSSAAEVTNTDYIDPLSSGFQISSTAPAAINANGGSYIYFSVA